MPRFIARVTSVKDCRQTGKKSVHLKVRFQATSLRTKSSKCEAGGKAVFDESFCFGVPPNPKTNDVLVVQLRGDGMMRASKCEGRVEVPLSMVFGGSKINKWYAFDTQGQVQLQIQMADDAAVHVSDSRGGASRLGARAESMAASRLDGPDGENHEPRFDEIQTNIENSLAKQKPLGKPKANFSSSEKAVEQPQIIYREAPKPLMRDSSLQTDRQTLTRQEVDAMMKRLPDPASFQNVSTGANTDSQRFTKIGVGQQGDLDGSTTFTTKPNYDDPWKALISLKGGAGGGRHNQAKFPAAMRDPTPGLSPVQVAALRAASAAWPEDEVEGILLYCERLQRENDQNSLRLARQALATAKTAASQLSRLSTDTPDDYSSPRPTIIENNQITPPSVAMTSSTPPRSPGSQPYHNTPSSNAVRTPRGGPVGNRSPSSVRGPPPSKTSATPLFATSSSPQTTPVVHNAVTGGAPPSAQDWFDTFGMDLPQDQNSADVKQHLEYLYDCL